MATFRSSLKPCTIQYFGVSSNGLGTVKSLRSTIWNRTFRLASMAVPDSSPSPWLTCGSPMENSAPSTCTG